MADKTFSFFDAKTQTSFDVLYHDNGDGTYSQVVSPQVAYPASVQRTPAITSVNASGSVAAGKRFIEFMLSADFAGTIGGVTFAGTTDYSVGPFIAPVADTLGAIAYTISAGSMRILTVT
jgi:hypothetical protein